MTDNKTPFKVWVASNGRTPEMNHYLESEETYYFDNGDDAVKFFLSSPSHRDFFIGWAEDDTCIEYYMDDEAGVTTVTLFKFDGLTIDTDVEFNGVHYKSEKELTGLFPECTTSYDDDNPTVMFIHPKDGGFASARVIRTFSVE